ncbi:MAG: TonB-dependent receptor [Paludibacter sp.]|nr:TonB-dependent receptor [Paludibacter sp.]
MRGKFLIRMQIPLKLCKSFSKRALLLTIAYFTFVLTISAQEKKITIKQTNKQLSEILNEIESKSGYSFLVRSSDLNLKQIVSIDAKNLIITEILSILFKNKGINYEINGKNVSIYIPQKSIDKSDLQKESKNVFGTVTDEKGVPIIGASIIINGTTKGTITDVNGTFSLEVQSDSKIKISYIGYLSKEVAINNQDRLTITLIEDTKALEEVVVIGYGSMKKIDLTGAVTSANINAFKESPNVSIMQSLQGSVPGLNIGQVNEAGENPSFTIRGQNTFNAGNTGPLIVVDGIIYKGGMNDLNPSDVKSVDILKDASSASIYGSRAANGVILITTLSGEAKAGKPVITYSTSYSTQDPVNILRPLNREQWITRIKDAVWDKAYLAPDYITPNPNFNIESEWVAEEIKQGYVNGTDFNWLDAATQTGHTKNDFLSISGKNQGSTYYISLGITDQLGYIMNDKFKRYTGKINIENKINKWLNIGVQTNVNFGDYSGMTPTMGDIMRMSPLTSPYDQNGVLIRQPMGQNVPNPFQPTQINDLNTKISLFGNLYADINIPFIKGLTYRINYSHNYRTADRFQTDPNASNYQGSASKYNESEYDWTLDNILTYNRTFNVDHKVLLTLVSGREESQFETTSASNSVFPNLDLGYNNLSVGSNPEVLSTAWDESSLYYMGRAHYSYKNKYLGTFTLRRDGFSGFSETKKFAIFPSAALAWIISEEKFMQNKPLTIEFLKLRASYGQTGNRTAGRYSTLAKVTAKTANGYIYGDDGNVTVGQNVTSISNSDLQWETTLGTNLGIDFSILKNRITGNIEYYNTNTSNILYNRNLPYASGFSTITYNIGQIHNQGMEFSINTINIKTNDFRWETTFNFSINRNKVISIVGKWNDANQDGIEDDQISNSLFIGEPLNAIYSYNITGIYQLGDPNIPAGYKPGQYIVTDLNEDGLITTADRSIIGYKDPNYRFSLANTFKYKNFSLFVFINSVQGGKNYYMALNDPSSWGGSTATTNSNAVAWDYWTPANPNAKYQQLFYPTPVANSRIQDRSFIRLQNVSLSYQFDNKILKKIGIQNLKLYVSGQNLYTLTNWEGWDPETGQGWGANGSPVLRSFTAGLDVSF